MKKRLLGWSKDLTIYGALAIVIAVSVDWYRTKDLPRDNAPNITGELISGEYFDVVAQSHQQPVVVYFWATWCGACRFVTPTIDWLSEYYPVVAVSGASGADGRVQRYMAHREYQFNNLNDPKSDIFRSWGISVTPTIAIVKNGQVVSMTTGITTPPGLLARVMFHQ
ncbi:redoxin [Vibrio variabilis]|uniref:Redoxin n=1 Tax=Vibrio variabilis TaxID=990271 RepID=A0ABR4Y7Q9_9VIBR|nr:protein disulfide oxidoreductase [Vibrio variabilis]KHA59520.1 redoxin [Vibrio variabilis]